MFKRPYLLVALAVLIAGPLIANLVSRAVPLVPGVNSAEAGPPAEAEAPPAPPPPLPPPPASDVAQPMDAAIDAAPSLDPQGIEPAANGETQSLATRLAGDESAEPGDERAGDEGAGDEGAGDEGSD